MTNVYRFCRGLDPTSAFVCAITPNIVRGGGAFGIDAILGALIAAGIVFLIKRYSILQLKKRKSFLKSYETY